MCAFIFIQTAYKIESIRRTCYINFSKLKLLDINNVFYNFLLQKKQKHDIINFIGEVTQMDISAHDKILDVLQKKYNENITEYTRLTKNVLLLHMEKIKYNIITQRFAMRIHYFKLAVQDGEKFKIKSGNYSYVSCEKDGTIIAKNEIFGIEKTTYFNKFGKRILKRENNNQ